MSIYHSKLSQTQLVDNCYYRICFHKKFKLGAAPKSLLISVSAIELILIKIFSPQQTNELFSFMGDKNSTHNMSKLSLGFSHHYLHLLGSSHNHSESESYTTNNQPNHSAPEVIKYISSKENHTNFHI